MNCAASPRASSSGLGLIRALLCNFLMQFLPFIIPCGTTSISQLQKAIQIRETQTLFKSHQISDSPTSHTRETGIKSTFYIQLLPCLSMNFCFNFKTSCICICVTATLDPNKNLFPMGLCCYNSCDVQLHPSVPALDQIPGLIQITNSVLFL